MSKILISKELSGDIATKTQLLEGESQVNIDNFLQLDNSFQNIFKNTEILLKENYYVIIKNIGFVENKFVFESFIKLFGNFVGPVVFIDIKNTNIHDGREYNAIELHNDYVMDLEQQPLYGFIQVQNEDPLKLTMNGLVKVDDIVKYLKVHDNKLLNELLTINISMLVDIYNGETKSEIVVKEPILYKQENNYYVRFSISRVNYYYYKNNIIQPLQEQILINSFLDIAKKFRIEIYLERGDILIHNNKQVLHDRTECSFELNLDGSFSTREIFVGFANE